MSEYMPEKWLVQVKLRYEELSNYGYQWKSFYNGALEGFVLAYQMGIITIPEGSKLPEKI